MHEDWPEYVGRVTERLERKVIAAAADINVSGVSRWVNGVSPPRPEKAISFARGLNLDPVYALVAAGYLDEDDVGKTVEIVQSLGALSNERLIGELVRRLRLVDDAQHRGAGLARLEREAQNVGVEDANEGHQKGNGPL